MSAFLKVVKDQIVENATPVRLKGVNLGGWLMMESYLTGAPFKAARFMKEDFEKRLGQPALEAFDRKYRENFIRPLDFERIAQMGCTCIRLPFHHGMIETAPYEYDIDGAGYLDRAIRRAKACGLRVILDLHAAPGAQNHDWHSDSTGKAGLWESPENRRRVCALWAFLADRYKNNTAVAGYDLLNEPSPPDAGMLNAFYADVIRAVRAVDRNHILFIEGTNWAMDLECLDEFEDDNWAYSAHFYHPTEFVFNFVPQLRYPLRSASGVFGKAALKKLVHRYRGLARKRPVLIGEFGIHSRSGCYGDDVWLDHVLACFEEAGYHWTYWTYKAVKGHMFPDGIYSYFPNSPWVNRFGPKTGWDTWAEHWPRMNREMARSWRTEHFDVNQSVLDILKKYL